MTDETLVPPIESILADIAKRAQEEQTAAAPSVPEQIQKTSAGIEKFGHEWADQIETAAKKQLEQDTARYEQAVALANQIRTKSSEVAKNVSDWAVLTRNAGLDIKGVFEKLNGHAASNGDAGAMR